MSISELSPKEVARLVKDVESTEPRDLDVEALKPLLLEAAARFHVTVYGILSRGRTKSVAAARQWAMAEARVRFGWSLTEVGRAFGRHHTTVISACAVQSGKRRVRVA